MTTPLQMAEDRLAEARREYESLVRRFNPDWPGDAPISMQGSLGELLKAERVRRAFIDDLIAIGPNGDVEVFAHLLYEDEVAHLVEETCRAVMVVEGLLLAAQSGSESSS